MNRSTKGLLAAGLAVAVPAVVNAVIAARTPEVTTPLPGDLGYYDWVYGRVAFYRLGQGAPLLLIHSPYPGSSAWEWRKLFPALANEFTVYALDLLGFGLSDKPNVPYSGRMYAELTHDFLQDVVGQRADAIGSALGCSYLVNTAVRRPELLRRLVLANPIGASSALPAYREFIAWNALRSPILGTALYNSLVTAGNIEQELITHYYYDASMVTLDVVDTLYAFAHQPGSQYAAAAFMTGRLGLPLRLAFSSLTQPVLLLWSRDAYYTPIIEAADLLYRHPETRLEIIEECGMLPHDEKAGEVIHLVSDFLSEPEVRREAA